MIFRKALKKNGISMDISNNMFRHAEHLPIGKQETRNNDCNYNLIEMPVCIHLKIAVHFPL
jgi:hypothetical protein